MNIKKTGTLSKDFIVDEKYKVLLFIKSDNITETYRVRGGDGKLYFLKIFNLLNILNPCFDNNGDILEIKYLRGLEHRNIVRYANDGQFVYQGIKFKYLILEFIPGETLVERILRDPITSVYDIKQITIGILEGLKYLHTLPEPIIHNEITLQNVMIDLSQSIIKPIIIDFGYARSFHLSTSSLLKEGLDDDYFAPEFFNNVYSPLSDLYSVGCLMYRLIFGIAPWFKGAGKFSDNATTIAEIILYRRKKPLVFPPIPKKVFDFDDSIVQILKKALDQDPERRFQSANEFINVLAGEVTVTELLEVEFAESPLPRAVEKKTKVKNGKGFSAIAGMEYLKDQLRNDVINLIENPEEYKKHNLNLPNGMLLYGPPGCGKTFFAERFAEEAGYNFIKVISSDIASIYVHGAQEKIGQLFKEARELAPTILFFDELDAMVPSRENVNTQSQSGEVNEFLSQLDNIGEAGVFVIGSTNKPDSIDKAVLRSGRLEKWFYISPPDHKARKAMFQLYLKDRPIELGIDYNHLATLTKNYVSSDIKLLIDEASRKTIRDKAKRISMNTLNYMIEHQLPTVSISELEKYEALRYRIERGS